MPPPHNSLQSCQSPGCQFGCKAGTVGAGEGDEEGAGEGDEVLGRSIGRDVAADSTILPFNVVPPCTFAWKAATEATGMDTLSTTLPASMLTLTSDSSI